MLIRLLLLLVVVLPGGCASPGRVAAPPPGFTPLFDGVSLAGWHAPGQEVAAGWRVERGVLITDGQGPHLCTTESFGDFELLVDWMITPGGDSGVYLRGVPQVQIWDPASGVPASAVGSGGLYNNRRHGSVPLSVADRAPGQWNTFRIRLIGERVTVWLNGVEVVADTPLENHGEAGVPLPARGRLELQTHGSEVRFRNIFLRPIDGREANAFLSRDEAGFSSIFNGHDLAGWRGSTDGYVVKDGVLVCDPERGGYLFTDGTWSDFVLRFEFRLPPGGNNGVAVRAPLEGNPAYEGMEFQVLDNDSPMYASLQPWQYHGSIYGVYAAARGYLRPTGAWNHQEITCDGTKVRVALNGTTILEADLDALEPQDGQAHPGLRRRDGHVCLMGHGDPVAFRNLRIRSLR